MPAYNAKDLGRSFRTVRKNTIQIAEEIPEDKYDFHPAEGVRSVGDTLRHIASTPLWALHVHGERITQMRFELFQTYMAQQAEQEKALKTKADIVKALNDNGEAFATFLEGLSDEVLDEQVHFPPESGMPSKTRFEMLLSAKEHEMHHRAQLMVAERMLGIVPHLTRAMQERMAAMNQQPAAAAKA